jgi:hypothetical protein
LPKFVADIYAAFLQLIQGIGGTWDTTPVTTRLIIAVAMAGLGVYLGSRSEHTGLSAMLFFAAFGFFAYVIAVGITLVH